MAAAGVSVYSKTFGYDAVGNRLQQVHTDTAGTVTTTNYGYDDRDRLLTEGAQSWTWDANGNLTAKLEEAVYAWDFDHRLQQVTLEDGTVVTHTYDADGVRVRTETRKTDGTTTTTDYLVDTSGPLSQVVAETTSVGGAPAVLSAYYVRGDDLLAVMRPGEGGGWASRFYHADGLGSIRALTDEAGNVTDRWSYTAFGELLSHEGEDPQGYLFAGEILDPNAGWYYNRARWVDPSSGRFTSQDTFEGLEFEPGTLHKYLYVRNNPVSAVDPTGHSELLNLAIVGAIITAIWANIAFPQTTALGRVKVTLLGAAFGALAFAGLAIWAGAAAVAVVGAGAAATAGAGTAVTAVPGVVYNSEAIFAGQVLLPPAANRVMLGHYGYQGFIAGGDRVVTSFQAGLRYLQVLGARLPGVSRTLRGLTEWRQMQQAIDEADQIVFNISESHAIRSER